MKKIASFFATIAAVAALSACSQDDSPVLMKPTEFKLNTPPFSEQLYQLTPEGEMQFTCSQPDYGVGVQTTYGMEFSFTEDFAEYATISANDPYSATITLSQEKIAVAICELLGVVDEDTWEPYANDHVKTMYFRATAQVGDAEYSKINSNVVTLPQVEFYYALKTPGFIYLIGSPSGWNAPATEFAEALKPWRLYEDENAIGSNVYSAVFDMPAAPMFRFYTSLYDDKDKAWDLNSVGSQTEDNPLQFSLGDGQLELPLYNGKGSFEFADFAGGEMTIVVDLNTMTATFEAGAVEVTPPAVTTYVYMVGNNANWLDPDMENESIYNEWRLSCTDGSGVYSETFDLANLPADDLYCRFYDALVADGWGTAKWASDPDGSVNVEVSSGSEYPTYTGDGCFQMNGAKGKTVNIILDTNTNKVKFTFVD